ncbi:hypothetical protein ACFL5O_01460 [Myxococcota bacterium]
MRSRRGIAASWLFLVAFGCSATLSEPRVDSVSGLPQYSSEEAVHFDDAFALEVFEAGRVDPAQDPNLLKRVRSADSVLAVRVATVTVLDRSAGCHLELRPVAPALSGRPIADPIALSIPPASSSYQLVASTGFDLIGTTLILFLRRYKENGRPVFHWHASLNTPELRAAVRIIVLQSSESRL